MVLICHINANVIKSLISEEFKRKFGSWVCKNLPFTFCIEHMTSHTI